MSKKLPKLFKEYGEMHSEGIISIENVPARVSVGDLGIQIAKDGRVWICIDGVAFLRFMPKSKYKKYNEQEVVK